MKTLIVSLLLLSRICLAQTPTWITYNTTNSGLANDFIASIEFDGSNNKWIGTVYGGLSKFDGSLWTAYTPFGLVMPNAQCITVDPSNSIWVGCTWTSLVTKYANNKWTVYDSAATNDVISNNGDRTFDILSNNGKIYVASGYHGLKLFDGTTWSDLKSNLPSTFIHDLEKDKNGNLWVGFWNAGITKFDGNTWTNYNTSNSSIPSDNITSIAFESNGTLWATSHEDGLIKFDGTTWTVYNTSNSGLPSNIMNTIRIDANDVKWIATGDRSTNGGSGLVKFVSPTSMAVYNTSNSGIPSNDVTTIAIDKFNNKWIGTERNGVGVFNESGIVSVNEVNPFDVSFSYYPNPFTDRITFSVKTSGPFEVVLYDISGRIIKKGKSDKGVAVIKRDNLAPGVYGFSVYQEGLIISGGKIIAE